MIMIMLELRFGFFLFFLNYLFSCNLCVDTIADIIYNGFYGTICNFFFTCFLICVFCCFDDCLDQ